MAAITGVGMLSHNAIALSKNPIIGRVLGPLATGGTQGLCESDQHTDVKMTIKITGRAPGNDDYANTSVARELFQRLGDRVAHLRVEIHAPCAAQRNNRNSIGYLCRQNIGVHLALLKNIDGAFTLLRWLLKQLSLRFESRR